MADRRPLGRQAGRLVLELLVVFIGVYAAFALNTWREDRREDARQRQILQALHTQVAWVHESVSRMAPGMDASLSAFLTELEAGEMPAVQPITITGGEIGVGLWEALLQSGGLDVLDAQTIGLMHTYFGVLASSAERLREAREQSRLQVYPDLGRGPQAFYDTRTRALRPEYGWYPDAIRRMRSDLRTISTLGDSALVVLDALLDTPPADSLAYAP